MLGAVPPRALHDLCAAPPGVQRIERPGRGVVWYDGGTGRPTFAPARDPEVVVVLVERGGKGGQVAAPIARQRRSMTCRS